MPGSKFSKSNDYFRHIIENSGDVIWVMDLKSQKFSYMSPSVFKLNGYTVEEMLELQLKDIVTPESYAFIQEQIIQKTQEILSGNESATRNTIEVDQYRKDGSIISSEIVTTILLDEDNNPFEVLGITHDVSSRKHVEKLALILNNVNAAMQTALSPDEIFHSISTQLLKSNIDSSVFLLDAEKKSLQMKYLSYEAEKVKIAEGLAGIKVSSFSIKVDDFTEYKRAIYDREAVFVKDPLSFVQKILPRPLRGLATQILKLFKIPVFVIAPIIYEDQVMGIVTIQSSMLNESDLPTVSMFAYHFAGSWHRGELFEKFKNEKATRKLIENELIDKDEKYQNVLNWSPIGIYHSTIDGKILAANNSLARMLGYKDENELLERATMDDLYATKEDRYKFIELHKGKKAGELLQNIEFQLKKKDGTPIWIVLTAHSIFDENNNHLYFEGFVQDIEMQKSANFALEHSISEFKATLESTNEGILVVSLDGKVTNWNKRFTDIWKIPNEILVSANDERMLNYVLDCFNNPSDFIDRVRNIYSLPEQDSFDILELKDGKIYERYSHPQMLDNKPVGRVWSFRDVTEKVNVIESLKKRENQYRILFEGANDSIFIMSQDEFMACNDMTLTVFECETKEEIVGLHPWEFSPDFQPDGEDSKIKALQYIDAAMKGDVQRFYWKHITKKKNLIDCEVSLNRIVFEDGVFLQAIVRDISDRKKAEKEIHDREFWLSASQKFARIGTYYLDIQTGLWKCTETLDSIFGIDASYPKTIEAWSLIICEEDREMMTKYFLEHVLGKKQPFDREYRIVRQNDQQLRWVHGRGDLTFDEHGNTLAMLGTISDINERKLMEEELTIAKDKAEESSRLKSSLLLNISHELRTPMNGILGFAEILSDSISEHAQRRMAENILFSGNRLKATLDSIVDLSQVQADSKLVRIEKINIGKEIDTILYNFKDVARTKNISLKLSAKDGLYAQADLKLVNNIVHHLVDNALKFTDKGSVRISTYLDESGNWVVLSVKDTGIGIAKENLSLIFDEFRQVSEGMGRSYEGTGLGLTLCKKFVELMKGEIKVISEHGVGTEFLVLLPAYITEIEMIEQAVLVENKINEKPSRKFDGKNTLPVILLVEDQEYNLELIEIYLSGICETDRALDGMTAVKMAFTRNYDAILMDVNLGPGIDGLEATQKIRAIKGYEDVPVIAVTGYTTVTEKKHILANGCTHYLSKPYNRANMIAVVREALGL